MGGRQVSMQYVTREMFLMKREWVYPTTEEFEVNIGRLLYRVNNLLAAYINTVRAVPAISITSGYRPGEHNKGYSPKSAHVTCEAVDIYDPKGALKAFCTKEILEQFDLWMEHPSATISWCHLSTRAPNSGRRIFYP